MVDKKTAYVCLVALAQYGCAQGTAIEATGDKASIRYIDTRSGTKVGITDRLILKLAKGYDIEPLAKHYGFERFSSLGGGLYVVKLASIDTMLATVDALKAEKGVVYVHPDYVRRHIRR